MYLEILLNSSSVTVNSIGSYINDIRGSEHHLNEEIHSNEFLLVSTVQVLQGFRQIFIKDVARIQRGVVAIESCFHLS